MTTRYLDPEGGNDANNGSTFSLRKKTLASAVAGLAVGDDVRVIASPDPGSIGTASWTDNSASITIPSGLVKLIDDCNSGFTASANVTATTNASRKSGSTAQNLAIATAFTTGKVAYKALGATLDLSAFNHLSVWFYSDLSSIVAGSLELRLCSDATGDVTVATLPLDKTNFPYVGAAWCIRWQDFGSALPSNVNSISIWATVDPHTSSSINIRINNLIACKAQSASNHLSHLSLIGKNTGGEPEWYPILSFSNDTTVLLGGDYTISTPTGQRPYRGTTESVTTYALRPMIPGWSLAERTMITGSGTPSYGNGITVSGGWNRTDMSTQTGATWITGAYNQGQPFVPATYNTFSKLGFAHWQAASVLLTLATGNRLDLEGIVACFSGFTTMPPSSPGILIKSKFVHSLGGSAGIVGGLATTSGPVKVDIGRVHGCTSVGVVGTATNPNRIEWKIGKIDNNFIGVGAAGGGTLQLAGTTITNNGTDVRIANPSTAILLHNCTYSSVVFAATDAHSALLASNINGDPLAHGQQRVHYAVATDSVTRRTSPGVSWKLSPTSVTGVTVDHPVEIEIARVALKAGLPTTVDTYVQRSNSGITAGIKVRGGYIAGVADQNLDAGAPSLTGWEKLTLTFTPTQDGVLPIYAYAYGGTTFSAWFDDFAVTQ